MGADSTSPDQGIHADILEFEPDILKERSKEEIFQLLYSIFKPRKDEAIGQPVELEKGDQITLNFLNNTSKKMVVMSQRMGNAGAVFYKVEDLETGRIYAMRTERNSYPLQFPKKALKFLSKLPLPYLLIQSYESYQDNLKSVLSDIKSEFGRGSLNIPFDQWREGFILEKLQDIPQVIRCDGVGYDDRGRLWLLEEWLDYPTTKLSKINQISYPSIYELINQYIGDNNIEINFDQYLRWDSYNLETRIKLVRQLVEAFKAIRERGVAVSDIKDKFDRLAVRVSNWGGLNSVDGLVIYDWNGSYAAEDDQKDVLWLPFMMAGLLGISPPGDINKFVDLLLTRHGQVDNQTCLETAVLASEKQWYDFNDLPILSLTEAQLASRSLNMPEREKAHRLQRDERKKDIYLRSQLLQLWGGFVQRALVIGLNTNIPANERLEKLIQLVDKLEVEFNAFLEDTNYQASEWLDKLGQASSTELTEVKQVEQDKWGKVSELGQKLEDIHNVLPNAFTPASSQAVVSLTRKEIKPDEVTWQVAIRQGDSEKIIPFLVGVGQEGYQLAVDFAERNDNLLMAALALTDSMVGVLEHLNQNIARDFTMMDSYDQYRNILKQVEAIINTIDQIMPSAADHHPNAGALDSWQSHILPNINQAIRSIKQRLDQLPPKAKQPSEAVPEPNESQTSYDLEARMTLWLETDVSNVESLERRYAKLYEAYRASVLPGLEQVDWEEYIKGLLSYQPVKEKVLPVFLLDYLDLTGLVKALGTFMQDQKGQITKDVKRAATELLGLVGGVHSWQQERKDETGDGKVTDQDEPDITKLSQLLALILGHPQAVLGDCSSLWHTYRYDLDIPDSGILIPAYLTGLARLVSQWPDKEQSLAKWWIYGYKLLWHQDDRFLAKWLDIIAHDVSNQDELLWYLFVDYESDVLFGHPELKLLDMALESDDRRVVKRVVDIMRKLDAKRSNGLYSDYHLNSMIDSYLPQLEEHLRQLIVGDQLRVEGLAERVSRTIGTRVMTMPEFLWEQFGPVSVGAETGKEGAVVRGWLPDEYTQFWVDLVQASADIGGDRSAWFNTDLVSQLLSQPAQLIDVLNLIQEHDLAPLLEELDLRDAKVLKMAEEKYDPSSTFSETTRVLRNILQWVNKKHYRKQPGISDGQEALEILADLIDKGDKINKIRQENQGWSQMWEAAGLTSPQPEPVYRLITLYNKWSAGEPLTEADQKWLEEQGQSLPSSFWKVEKEWLEMIGLYREAISSCYTLRAVWQSHQKALSQLGSSLKAGLRVSRGVSPRIVHELSRGRARSSQFSIGPNGEVRINSKATPVDIKIDKPVWVVSGPTGSGKTGFLEVAAWAIAFGGKVVGPAESLQLPEGDIELVWATGHNVIEGYSLFASNVVKVREALRRLDELERQGKKACLVIDEAFLGAPTEYAASLLAAFIEQVKRRGHILILADHKAAELYTLLSVAEVNDNIAYTYINDQAGYKLENGVGASQGWATLEAIGAPYTFTSLVANRLKNQPPPELDDLLSAESHHLFEGACDKESLRSLRVREISEFLCDQTMISSFWYRGDLERLLTEALSQKRSYAELTDTYVRVWPRLYDDEDGIMPPLVLSTSKLVDLYKRDEKSKRRQSKEMESPAYVDDFSFMYDLAGYWDTMRRIKNVVKSMTQIANEDGNLSVWRDIYDLYENAEQVTPPLYLREDGGETKTNTSLNETDKLDEIIRLVADNLEDLDKLYHDINYIYFPDIYVPYERALDRFKEGKDNLTKYKAVVELTAALSKCIGPEAKEYQFYSRQNESVQKDIQNWYKPLSRMIIKIEQESFESLKQHIEPITPRLNKLSQTIYQDHFLPIIMARTINNRRVNWTRPEEDSELSVPLAFKDGYNLPLFRRLRPLLPYTPQNAFWDEAANKPVDQVRQGKVDAVEVTGLNNGGKTAWVEQQAQMLAFYRLFGWVPAKEAVVNPRFTKFLAALTDVGTSGLDSAFTSHARDLSRVTQAMIAAHKQGKADQMGVFLDEPGRNTASQETQAIVESILILAKQLGVTVYFTNHEEYSLEDVSPDKRPNILTLGFIADPDHPYSHQIGTRAGAESFNVARQLGLPDSLIDRAEQYHQYAWPVWLEVTGTAAQPQT